MVNNKRIVPVSKIDLISLVGLIFNIADNSEIEVLEATKDGAGTYEISANESRPLCDAPLKTLNFTSAITSASVIFVPAYDYEGFTYNGTKIEPGEGSVTVNPDGADVYIATYTDGALDIAPLTPLQAGE